MSQPDAASGTRSKLAPHLPILNARLARSETTPTYQERELSEPTLLCDARGRLNPSAVGWSRAPLVKANLKGRWPRKKKWNFWNWISREFVFSVTVADLDYASFCAASFIHFETGESLEAMDLKWSGFTPMPEEVEQTVRWKSAKMDYAAIHEGDRIRVEFHCADLQGSEVRAEFTVEKPKEHESLNVVVPWTPRHFQLNSKDNTLPCAGHVTVGGRRFEMAPESCHAVQDFGRGVWPYRSFWNWGVCTGRQGDTLIGVNLGDKWTTGTGSNENGICYNGRLTKIMEDLRWDYDPSDWMKPWRVRTLHSDGVDLTLTPVVARTSGLRLGLLSTGGTCAFGAWKGVVRFEDREIEIRDLMGWAEEFAHRW